MDDEHLIRSLRAFAEHRIECPARPHNAEETECTCGVISAIVAANVMLGLPLEHRPRQLARVYYPPTQPGNDPRRYTRGT